MNEVPIFSFGELMVYMRSQSLLTQSQFAKKVGISRSLVVYLENGWSIPYGRTVDKIISSFPKWTESIKQHESILRTQKKTRKTFQAKYVHTYG